MELPRETSGTSSHVHQVNHVWMSGANLPCPAVTAKATAHAGEMSAGAITDWTVSFGRMTRVSRTIYTLFDKKIDVISDYLVMIIEIH